MISTKQRLVLLLIFCIPFISFSQTRIDFGRNYSEKLPDTYLISPDTIREHIHNGIPDHLKFGAFERECYAFSDQNGLRISDMVASGKAYSDWQGFEQYINRIIRKIMPDDLKEDKGIHAYLFKEGTYNAFMTPSGMTFIHMGLFTDVFDEASVAGVLAHELAHYYMQHSLKRFIKQEKGEFRNGIIRRNKSASNFSIANELQSDSLAMVWLKNAGYDLNGLVESFSMMERMQANQLLKIQNVWELKAVTHPLSSERLAQINDFIAKNEDYKGKPFIISEAQFKKFIKEAKPEILKHLLNNFNYDYCIEVAFKFHIYDVNNPLYSYYLMEAIRRKCYLDTDMWNKKFITYRYFDIINGDDVKARKKVKKKDHLFKKMPIEILRLNPNRLDEIEAKFYWEDLKFVTYEEAFEFFFKISQMLKEPESYLTYALSVTFDKKIRDKHLKEYLAFDNIRYKDYAESLLSSKIHDNLNDKKLTIFSDFRVNVKQGKESIPIRRMTNEDESNQLKKLMLDALKDKEGRKLVFMSDMKLNQLNTYSILSELEYFSFIRIKSKGEKTELHIFDPRYWKVMHDLGVNEIEFVNCLYTETRKKEKSLEAYKDVMEMELDEVFAQVKRSRYVDIIVTSLRMIDGSVMKIQFYPGENKLKFKKDGQSQIIKLLQKIVERKDKYATGQDNLHKNDK